MSRPHKRRFQNDDERKEKYNSTISSSIADIIRFSLDDNFRSQCFQFMQVDNTNDFQVALKEKLDSLINLSSSTLQKRPSFHDDEAEGSSARPPDRNSAVITQVNTQKQTDENIEKPSTLRQNITDSNIEEITKVLKMTNILEEKIAGKYKLPGTSGDASIAFGETEDIKRLINIRTTTFDETLEIKKLINDITQHNLHCNGDKLAEKIEDFWPTEECCLWDPCNDPVTVEENDKPMSLQEDINNSDLNENDTVW